MATVKRCILTVVYHYYTGVSTIIVTSYSLPALPSGVLPSGALPSDALLSGDLLSGALPSGALTSGALPSDALTSGALPSGLNLVLYSLMR